MIDPGPDIESHVAALVEAVGERLKWILCTHTHQDHSPAAPALKAATGAQIAGTTCPQDGRQDEYFAADRVLDGRRRGVDRRRDAARGFTRRATCRNHLCYLLEEQKLLFTGDHVMQGSTVVIAPAERRHAGVFRFAGRSSSQLDLAALAPGHGHLIEDARTTKCGDSSRTG